MKRHVKKLAAWALALCLALGMLPCAALAEEPIEEETPVEVTEPVESAEEEVAEETEEAPEEVPEETETVPETPEEEPVPENTLNMIQIDPPIPTVYSDEYMMNAGVMAIGEGWSGTRYYDQLTGLGRTIYEEMELAFSGKNDTNVKYESRDMYVQHEDGSVKLETHFCAIYERAYTTIKLTSKDQDELDADVQAACDKYEEELSFAWRAFIYDHPEYFWIRYAGNGYMTCENELTGTWGDLTATLVVVMLYQIHSSLESADVRANYDSGVKQVVGNIIAGLDQDAPRAAKLAYFDHWLSENNSYNREAGKSSGYSAYNPKYMDEEPNGVAPWNITSALLGAETPSPVCEGYAKAFQLLCHEIKVPCVTISGSGHMWNAVQMEDGNWYFVDVTWDDALDSRTQNDPDATKYDHDYSSREYFLIWAFDGSEDDRRGHIIQQDLATPNMASEDYFNTIWHADVNASGEGGNTCWIARYEEVGGQGKMLGLVDAVSFYWTGENSGAQNRLILPNASSTLEGAGSMKAFTVNKSDGYKPVGAAQVVPINTPAA